MQFLTIPSFVEAGGIICAFSARTGGVSPQPYNTLNFSRKREQSEKNFTENSRRFSFAAGFDYGSAVCIHYAHSASLYRARRSDAGCGVVRGNVPQICDGLYTDTQGLPILSFHADCAALFFYDAEKRAAAICHAGWKGTSQHIAKNAVEALKSLGCEADNIIAAVGPCIGAENYEVGYDVAKIFLNEFGETVVRQNNGFYHVDLASACALDMIKSGIVPQHITISGLCTYEREDLFFSHRRDEGRTGAMAAVLELI